MRGSEIQKPTAPVDGPAPFDTDNIRHAILQAKMCVDLLGFLCTDDGKIVGITVSPEAYLKEVNLIDIILSDLDRFSCVSCAQGSQSVRLCTQMTVFIIVVELANRSFRRSFDHKGWRRCRSWS